MNGIVNGKMTAIFVKHLKGEKSAKSGKPYNFIELSNGLEKKLFSATIDLEETEAYNVGDPIQVEVECSPFDPRHGVVSAVV